MAKNPRLTHLVAMKPPISPISADNTRAIQFSQTAEVTPIITPEKNNITIVKIMMNAIKKRVREKN